MKKEEVYISVDNLNEAQITKLCRLTGINDVNYISSGYLHYYEPLNKWINFSAFSDEFNKELVHHDELFEILEPKPLSWYKKLLNKIKPKEKIVIDVNKITSYILLFVALSHLNKGFNPFEWSKTGLAIAAIIYLFYTKNSDKCSN